MKENVKKSKDLLLPTGLGAKGEIKGPYELPEMVQKLVVLVGEC